MRRTVFVIGDLVIDHTIFVRQTAPTGRIRLASARSSFEVLRRQDRAGGAATHRQAAGRGERRTDVLVGVPVGSSQWGSFEEVLDKSQELDGGRQRIVFRTHRDDSGARTHTSSRVLAVSGNPPI